MEQGGDNTNWLVRYRLKQKAQSCNLVVVDHEMKDQIVINCHSDCLRRKAW